MAFLNVANNANSTLLGGIDSVVTSLVVDPGDGDDFPAVPFVVSIDGEIIYVGAKTDDTFSSLTRGYESTTPTAHGNKAVVENRWTAGQVLDLQRLPNDTYLRGRNNADGADLDIVKINATDEVEFGTTVAAIDIDGGTVDGAIIGGTVAAAGTFTTVTLDDGQVIFPAIQNASADGNTLDDYEEGTWTPALTFPTPGDQSIAYNRQVGTYTKVGRLAHLQLQVRTSTFTHTTATGNLQITGLPFTSETLADGQVAGSLFWRGITNASYTHAVLVIGSNAVVMTITLSGSGQAVTGADEGDAPTGGTVHFTGGIAYRAAA